MLCTATLRSEVVKVAVPETSVPVPMAAAPSKKVTVPVGVPEPLLTVAVNVTGFPNTAGFCEVATDMVVAFPLTIWLSAVDVLGSKVASPWYAAVIECVPTTSAAVEMEALPAASRVPLPMEEVPSKKTTVPVGVPPAPVTVAVNVTDCWAVEGLSEETTLVVEVWP